MIIMTDLCSKYIIRDRILRKSLLHKINVYNEGHWNHRCKHIRLIYTPDLTKDIIKLSLILLCFITGIILFIMYIVYY